MTVIKSFLFYYFKKLEIFDVTFEPYYIQIFYCSKWNCASPIFVSAGFSVELFKIKNVTECPEQCYIVLNVVKSFVSYNFKKLHFISENAWDVIYLKLLLNLTVFGFLTNKILNCLSAWVVSKLLLYRR